jgi:hypothetical protein
VRTKIKRNAEQRRVGDAAPTNTPACLEQGDACFRSATTARSGDTGGPGANDDHIGVEFLGTRAQRRRHQQRRGASKE